jgi:Mrp family chromosome partitioning ATPase/capsular polysaccharide biosynthesis protein
MSWQIARRFSAKRRWGRVALAMVVGALLASAYGLRVTPVYEAKAILVVNAPVAGQLQVAAAQAPTYAELANSIPLLRVALNTLRLPLTPEELQPNVRGEADASTRLLTIRVRNPRPAVAVAIANSLADELIRRTAVAASSGRGNSHVRAGPRLAILQPASGDARIRPRLVLIAGFGALAGLFGGLAVAVLAGSAGRTVRRQDDLARLAPIPVLASVNGGVLPATRGSGLPAAPAAAESYLRLSTRILTANGGRAPRSLLVVGAQGNEGSAAVAGQLALALAGTIGRVVLADLASDRAIARLFGIGERSEGPSAKRLSLLRHGSLTLERFALRAGPPLALVLPRGTDAWSAGSEDARAVLALFLAEADFVVLHAASLASSPAALIWARMLDAAVVVVRPSQTRRESVVSAVEALGLARTNLVGTVLHTGPV